MHDEEVQLEQLDELDQYLVDNPDDTTALMFSAYCEDKKRWNNKIKYLNDEMNRTQQKIFKLHQQLNKLTRWGNFWRKLFNQEGHNDDITKQIDNLEDYTDRTFNELMDLTQQPPEDWRYKLAAIGNNLFKAR